MSPVKHLGIYQGKTETHILLDPLTREITFQVVGVSKEIIDPATGEAFPPVEIAYTREPETAVWISALGNLKRDLSAISTIVNDQKVNPVEKAQQVFTILKGILEFIPGAEAEGERGAQAANEMLEQTPAQSPIQKIS
jgi:hypothetical protein